MKAEPLRVLVLSDGKPGHRNQSLGLADALGRMTDVEATTLPVQGLLATLEAARQVERPDLLLGAGHAVHLALLLLGRRFDVPTVVLMKPSLPAALFDLCLVPEHDLERRRPGWNVIPTLGALNRVPPPSQEPKHGGMLLIGGPSAAHGWDEKGLLEMVKAVTARGEWIATDSRRTPEGTLQKLADACPLLTIFPHAETGSHWLPEKLAAAKEAWVTADSISMIYEALSSGAHVGLLPVPEIKRGSRVARGVARLAEGDWITPFPRWLPGSPLPAPPGVLREGDRCAALLLKRFFPDFLPK